jgi:hypothetical protein
MKMRVCFSFLCFVKSKGILHEHCLNQEKQWLGRRKCFAPAQSQCDDGDTLLKIIQMPKE